MEKNICIHGHFYQPPRENPWLEEVEYQETANPYHDWNMRITDECYAPNSVSRIMDPQGRIKGLVNNYSKISFNFGPTLLNWIAKNKPDLYNSILEADKKSIESFSGHGSAMAQAYNHMIMPLATDRDKRTQVKWGIEDFKKRFERDPEGMWLPETAVDIQTLEVLAENGIKFTILAPHQAKRIRRKGEENWVDVVEGNINTKRAYDYNLPSGKSITIFFYHKISSEVAFGNVLANGEIFAHKLISAFKKSAKDGLVNIATDGEVYGHHRPHGDMTLAYCLYHLASKELAKVTNYSEFLESHPPEFEVEIRENTSWSCIHGIERWRNDCGDSSGRHKDWNQRWRKPIREAMDWLRDEVAPNYENEIEKYVKDAWKARDEYIEIVLDRSRENTEKFLSRHAIRELNLKEKIKVMRLLEIQRHAMLMFTSCGWFFDDISGIETVQIMKYAARVMQLAHETLGLDLEDKYVKIIGGAKSNVSEWKNGAKVYSELVKPSRMNPAQISAQGIMISTFLATEVSKISLTKEASSFELIPEDIERLEEGKFRLAIGKIKYISRITLDERSYCCAAIWLGDHNISCGVKEDMSTNDFEGMKDELIDRFRKGQISESIQQISVHFGKNIYSLKNMFKDDQQRLLEIVTSTRLKEAEKLYEIIYNDNSALLRFMKETGINTPKSFQAATELVFNNKLSQVLSSEPINLSRLEELVEDTKQLEIPIDSASLVLKSEDRISRKMTNLREDPFNINKIEDLIQLMYYIEELDLNPNLWQAQNTAFKIIKESYEKFKTQQEEHSKNLYSAFRKLSESLGIRLD